MANLVAAALAVALAAAEGPSTPPDLAPPEPAVEPEPGPLRPRYVLERVELAGLVRTRPQAVRRHLLVREGEVLDDAAVLLSRLRLSQLGWFDRVETRVVRGSARGLVVLVVEVRERNTLLVSDLYVGSTDPQPLYGGLGLAEHNFLGRGLGLSGAFVYGGTPREDPLAPSRLSLRGAFSAPDLEALGERASAGLSALWVRGEELTCRDPECEPFERSFGRAPRLRYTRRGGALEAGLRTHPFARLLVSARLERLTASHVENDAAARDGGGGPLPPVRLGRSTLAALGVGWLRDTRDDAFLPRGGTRLDLALGFGSRALGGDYDYSRYLLQGELDLPLSRGQGLRLQLALGAVQGDAPFFERFYAADWAYFSLGPALGRALDLNFSTDSRYDRYLAMAGAEWAIPLWDGGRALRRGYLALGARGVFTSADAGEGRTRASRTPLSAEAALRLDTPVGVFNVSLGYLLDNFL